MMMMNKVPLSQQKAKTKEHTSLQVVDVLDVWGGLCYDGDHVSLFLVLEKYLTCTEDTYKRG